MVSKISGYRNMINYTQEKMANAIGVSEVTYRNKEKGRIPFKDYEMAIFHGLVADHFPEVSINDIFFREKLQKLQEVGGGYAGFTV